MNLLLMHTGILPERNNQVTIHRTALYSGAVNSNIIRAFFLKQGNKK